MLSRWYKTATGNAAIEQGEFIFDCPVIEIDENINYKELEQGSDAPAKAIIKDFIIITQSCDLHDEGIDNVIMCPVHLLSSMPQLSSKNKLGLLKSDRMPRFALLDKNDRNGFPQDHFIVDLASPHPLPLNYTKNLVAKSKKRLQLVSPYREYLSQKFAYLYMRVGKPSAVNPEPTDNIEI